MPLEIKAVEATEDDVIRESFKDLLNALQASMPFMSANEMLPFLKTGRDWACFKAVQLGKETPSELIEFKNDLDTIVNQHFPAPMAVVVIGDDEDGEA